MVQESLCKVTGYKMNTEGQNVTEYAQNDP
jgi:hypothetical protein